MVAAWPEPETLASWIAPAAARAVGMLCGVVGAVRSTRARYGSSPTQELAVVVNAQPENVTVLEELSSQISGMARVSEFAVAAGAPKPAESAAVGVEGAEVYSVLTGMGDFDEVAREVMGVEQFRPEMYDDDYGSVPLDLGYALPARLASFLPRPSASSAPDGADPTLLADVSAASSRRV